jgi:hypothetical protein
MISQNRHALPGLRSGNAEQADFRCRVEAESEQKPERHHVPIASH